LQAPCHENPLFLSPRQDYRSVGGFGDFCKISDDSVSFACLWMPLCPPGRRCASEETLEKGTAFGQTASGRSGSTILRFNANADRRSLTNAGSAESQ
jgi:hypothetical protein